MRAGPLPRSAAAVDSRECARRLRGLRIAVLGPPRIEVEGAPLAVDTRKAVALLAYLATTAGAHSREWLAALLWPESDRERARATLRRTLSALNSALGGRWVLADRSEVALAETDVWVDVHVFRQALQRPAAHDHPDEVVCERCLDDLDEAVGWYRDEFLVGFGLRDSAPFDDWQRHTADELRREVTLALDRLITARTRRGELDEAAAHAGRRLMIEPLHEPTHRRLVLLHAWRGRRAEAVRQYERCRQLLDRELGVEPLTETTAVYEAVRDGRPPPPPPAPVAPRPDVSSPTADTSILRHRLVGRDEPLAQLAEAHAAATGGGRVVAIDGEAGVGKTALLDAFAETARRRGATVVWIRGREAEQSLAYGVVADALREAAAVAGSRLAEEVPAAWLAEAARLAPELLEAHPDLHAGPALDAPETRRRLMEGARRTLLGALAGPAPGVLLVDDVQWVDDASLDALLYASDRLGQESCCVVFAGRAEALPGDHRLRRLVGELRRRGTALQLTLERLGADAVAELVAAAGLEDPDGEIATRLHHETRGVPLLVAEFLRQLRQRATTASSGSVPEEAASQPSSTPRSDTGEGWPLPSSVRELLQARIDAVTDVARELAATASVLSRPVDLDTLLAASSLGGTGAVAALEELLRTGILEERLDPATGAPPTYDFPLHPLRSLVYEATSVARRRLLHGRVADALAASSATTPADLAAIARHLQLAGRGSEAAERFVEAAQAAREVVALDEACAHLRAALALGHEPAGPLQETLADLETLRGDYPAAMRALRTAADAQSSPADQARLAWKLAGIAQRRGDWAAAEEHLRRGLDQLPVDHDALEARLHAELAVTSHRRGDVAAARVRGKQALEIAEAAGDPGAIALARNTLGMVARSEGALDEAVEHLEEARRLAEKLGDPGAAVAALNNLALTYGERGEIFQALELAKTALARCRRRGDRHREAALLNNIADLLHAANRREEAGAHLEQAVALFADVGHPEQLEPEIWRLVDW